MYAFSHSLPHLFRGLTEQLGRCERRCVPLPDTLMMATVLSTVGRWIHHVTDNPPLSKSG